MKYKKGLLVFCLIICVLFMVSSVAAGDVNDTAIASENQGSLDANGPTAEADNENQKIEDNLISSSNEYILSEKDNGTFAALRNKIDNAPDGSTIYLENDYIWHDTDHRPDYSDPIYIENRVLTIEGNGHKIDGSGKVGIFDISSSTITLNNIQFCNGYASSAGAIELGFSSVVITNSKFINNYANYSGGAIYSRVNNDVIKISNCIFDNNYGLLNKSGTISGGEGAAINFDDGKTGALAEVTNCEFVNNVAGRGGAIYIGSSFKSTLTIKNSKFLNNKAYYPSGAIDSLCEPEINIYDSTFKGNELAGIYGQWGDIIVHDGSYSDLYRGPVKFVVTPSTSLIAKSLTTIYNVNKNLIITLKDSNGNVVSGAAVSVNFNGVKNSKTDKNGQIKIATGSLVPKTYTVKISFAGNANYKASSKTVKVTVKKATPKLTVKSKTFKKSVKTKKYSVVLKTNKNKAMKNVKVVLKIKGKSINAKTNAKGVATFKITKMTKKGTFKSTVTYTGNKYYNKVTKTVKIKII